jgi:hypothetical protein
MNIKHILVLSACVTLSSALYTMNQDSNHDDLYTIDISMDNQNDTNHENNQLIVNNEQPINPNPQNKKSTMISLVNQLKVSLSEQRSKINKNILTSSILFGGGMISYAIGCNYNILPLAIVGIIQLGVSTIAGNFNNTHQAGEYHCENDITCNYLLQNINSLPDIENQLEHNN